MYVHDCSVDLIHAKTTTHLAESLIKCGFCEDRAYPEAYLALSSFRRAWAWAVELKALDMDASELDWPDDYGDRPSPDHSFEELEGGGSDDPDLDPISDDFGETAYSDWEGIVSDEETEQSDFDKEDHT